MIPVRATRLWAVPQIKREVTRRGVKLDATGWGKIEEAAFQVAGAWYFRNVVPKHFRPGAALEYDYDPRSDEHNRRKKRLFPENDRLALVFTGRTRLEVCRWLDLRVTPKKAELVLHAPAYFYMRASNKGELKGPDKAAELTRWSRTDERLFVDAMSKAMAQEIKKADEATRDEVQLDAYAQAMTG